MPEEKAYPVLVHSLGDLDKRSLKDLEDIMVEQKRPVSDLEALFPVATRLGMFKVPTLLKSVFIPLAFEQSLVKIGERPLAELSAEDLPSFGRAQRFILLLLRYPETSGNELIQFAKNIIKLDDARILSYGIAFGRKDIITYYQKNVIDDELCTLLEDDDSLAIKLALITENYTFLNWIAATYPTLLDEKLSDPYNRFMIAIFRHNHHALTWLKANTSSKPWLNGLNHCFQEAASNGNISLLNWFADKFPAKLQKLIASERGDFSFGPYQAFYNAAANGHLETLKWFKQKSPDKLLEMMSIHKYNYIVSLATNNRVDVLQWLLDQKIPWDDMLDAVGHWVLRDAAGYGHIEVLEWFEAHCSIAQFKTLIFESGDNEPYRHALAGGQLHLMQWLEEKNPLAPQALADERRYTYLEQACHAGHIEAVLWFADKVTDESLTALIEKNDEHNGKAYPVFQAAAEHLDILKWFATRWPERLPAMISVSDHYGNFAIFRNASGKGRLDVLQWCAENSPNALPSMIAAQNFYSLLVANSNGRIDIVHWLLQDLGCLNHAEMHVQEYSTVVNPFIDEKLRALHQVDPASIDSEKANYCFCILRNLIRRNASTEEINFLLSIPSLRDIASKNDNELLKLAISNSPSNGLLLLALPEVRRIAAQRDYYRRGEAKGEIDLRRLAANTESSMVGLTPNENNTVRSLTTHYQPHIATAGGVSGVMNALREKLAERYMATQPSLVVNGQDIKLPCEFKALDELELKGEDRQRALECYYKHRDHTALRYLSIPNHWINPVGHIEHSEDGQTHWASFVFFQELIATMYLAADDKHMPATDDFTLDSRMAHFVWSLSMLGREHNWDQLPRPNLTTGKMEPYDDLGPDKPSCNSGVKSRLFYSLIGHPLLNPEEKDPNKKLLTEDAILHEIARFAREYFKSKINDSNKYHLKAVFDAVVEGESGKELSCLDIPVNSQEAFIAYLHIIHGTAFTDFEPLVRSRFSGTPHAVQLDGLTEIRLYVDELCLAKDIPPTPAVRSLDTALETKQTLQWPPNLIFCGTKPLNPIQYLGTDTLQKNIVSDLNFIIDFYNSHLTKATNVSRMDRTAYLESLCKFCTTAVTIRQSDALLVTQKNQLRQLAYSSFTHRHAGLRLLADAILLISCFVGIGLLIGHARTKQGHAFFFSYSREATQREKELKQKFSEDDVPSLFKNK